MFKSSIISAIILPLSFLLLAGVGRVQAQEFDCEVTINNRQISGSSYEYVTELGQDMERYINENRWTDHRYQEQERIRCRIQVVLTSVDSDFNYSAEVIFSMRRPIYNTIQESSTVILSDNNWIFNYPRGKSLVKDELQFDDLTSFIDFYMYILLGLDYDTFSELGGSAFFNQAQEILEIAQTTNNPGWGRSIGAQRNRYGLVNDLTNPGYDDLRKAIYTYHRLGLDQFTLNPEDARSQILNALSAIQENKRRASRNYLFDIFFDTKYTEIVAVFRDAPVQRRLEAYNILRETDPGHAGEYERLQN